MTNPVLTLHGVSQVPPDGRTLFSDIHETFDARHTGIVGRNGVGKSVLGRILAGRCTPTTGQRLCTGSTHYLAQQTAPPPDATLAMLAGVHDTLQALARIEAGSTATADFDTVGEQWDVRLRLHDALTAAGLEHLAFDTPGSQLSGGEAMRAALAGAWLSNADFLILDEPTNHLDRPSRHALIEQLQRWPHGLIVISHDRGLLDTLDRIVALSPSGLRSYGGNYTHYAQARQQEAATASHTLAHAREQRRRDTLSMRQAEARQASRQARGQREGKHANQAKILVDRQKGRSETSTGKLRQAHAARREALAVNVREAVARVETDQAIAVHAPHASGYAERRLATLTDVVLPFVDGPTRHVLLRVTGRDRIGVVGPNGCGKSTLLRTLAGRLSPLAGEVTLSAPGAYLDQDLAGLDADGSVLAQLRQANAVSTDADLRMRLAQLGLDADRVTLASRALSGGERLKGALACVLYADPPPALLLLDEPSNHLDLASTQALEAMLRGYTGALVVVSHDDAFLQNIGLTDWLEAGPAGWRRVLQAHAP